MDVDRYIRLHRPTWNRLDDLTRRVRRRPSRLTAEEIDEFTSLYRRVSTQLSFARTHYDDPVLTAELNHTVGMANAAFYARRAGPVTSLRRFFAISFPAAVWHLRRVVGMSVVCKLFSVTAPYISSARILISLSGEISARFQTAMSSASFR